MFGEAYVYYGGTNSDNVVDLTISSNSVSSLGCSVAACKDFNGDNISDLIIGAELYYDHSGKCGVYFGNTNFDNIEDLTFKIGGRNAEFGNSITAGDLNNDGFKDIIVGAVLFENGTESGYYGRVFVYLGSENSDNEPDLVLYTMEDAFYGFTIAANGDINNDGFDDLIISAILNNYVFLGSQTLDTQADLIIPNDDFNSDILISYIGDFNGDNFDDFAIGNSQFNNNSGSTSIFLGNAIPDNISDLNLIGNTDSDFGRSVSSAGDVNNDGFDDLIIGANYEGKAYILLGSASPDNIIDITLGNQIPYFGISVSSAGDVNNDGFDDILVGSFLEKKAYLYLGGNQMDNIEDLVLTSDDPISEYGFTVAKIGDVNADNFDDFVVSCYYNNSETYNGFADIYFGANDLNDISKISKNGINDEGFGSSVFGLGDINNDTYDDFIIGAPSYGKNGAVYLFNGSSTISNIKNTDLNFEFYPNPSNGIVNLNTNIEINKIIVYDLTGKIVEQINNYSNSSIDLSNLKAGIYIINFQSENQNIKRKFIKL